MMPDHCWIWIGSSASAPPRPCRPLLGDRGFNAEVYFKPLKRTMSLVAVTRVIERQDGGCHGAERADDFVRAEACSCSEHARVDSNRSARSSVRGPYWNIFVFGATSLWKSWAM